MGVDEVLAGSGMQHKGLNRYNDVCVDWKVAYEEK